MAARLAAVVVAGLFLGTLSAWLSIGWSALFLLLLPCWALLFGLALARRSAMVATGALLIGNSLWATWPFPDPAVLIGVVVRMIVTGGVLLFVVTAAVNIVRTRRSTVRLSTAAVVFSAFLGWTLFLALPRWSHTYQVSVKTDAPLETVTLVLPMPMLRGEQFLELLNEAHYARPSGPHEMRTSATEFGKMVELDMALAAEDIPWTAAKQNG
ncbi:MAG: hypothetical protein HY678_07965 [Chloroflexi bacterium]|nr:hypothetical protein [Chloroflexota bacterium]